MLESIKALLNAFAPYGADIALAYGGGMALLVGCVVWSIRQYHKAARAYYAQS